MYFNDRLKTRLPLAVIAAACLAFTTAGCGGSSDSASGTATATPTPLPTPTPTPTGTVTPPTASQTQDAVDASAASVAAATEVLEPLRYLAEGDTTRSRAGGGGPQVTVTRSGENGVTVTVDFGAGYTGQGGITRSGIVSITYDRSLRSGSLLFTNYSVNGKTVSGTVTLTDLVITRTNVSLTAAADLTFGSGALDGAFSLSISSGEISVPNGSVTYSPDGAPAVAVSVTGIIINPTTNSNFIPNVGTSTIVYPFVTANGVTRTATITVTYTSDSPVTGTVLVSVNGSAQTPYTLERTL